jgi:hypothetical protein
MLAFQLNTCKNLLFQICMWEFHCLATLNEVVTSAI